MAIRAWVSRCKRGRDLRTSEAYHRVLRRVAKVFELAVLPVRGYVMETVLQCQDALEEKLQQIGPSLEGPECYSSKSGRASQPVALLPYRLT